MSKPNKPHAKPTTETRANAVMAADLFSADNPPPSTPNTEHKPQTLTDADAAADLAGTPRPIKLKVLRLDPAAQLPTRATDGSACLDLYALNVEGGLVSIGPGEAAVINTGLAFEVPEGYALMQYSRSGHGFKNGVRLSNSVGVVDSDYRGELRVRLANDSRRAFPVNVGDRVAQVMLVPVPTVELLEVDALSSTARGAGGYGSTGR